MHRLNEYSHDSSNVARSAHFVDQRAMFLDREADAMLFLGRYAQAERLSHLACEMREVAQ